MLASAIIDKKRDSLELSGEEIRFMIEGLVDGSVPDYQVSAWAMAVLCRGMTAAETAALTDAMLGSGTRLERATERPRVDKHSTGGLGDKCSLILAPLLACFEVDVPMLSGRGLGITGGTLDKLEAYAGYRCDLTAVEIDRQLRSIGCAITGTTPDLAPADRQLYALRDVTGTVPSMPLITASIMSKKLAESIDALVLDVKCGSGAFMRTASGARELAESLIATGQRTGLATRAVITDMNQPLGRMVGNACEANEAVAVMQGAGPADVRELTLRLGAELLVAVQRCDSLAVATEALAAALDDGRALHRFQRMVEQQAGRFLEHLPLAAATEVLSERSGWLAGIAGERIGRAVIELGGGRRRRNDRLDHQVGLEMLVRLGDRLEVGQPVVRIFSARPAATENARFELEQAFTWSEQKIEGPRLFL